jgi:hypothetical protein
MKPFIQTSSSPYLARMVSFLSGMATVVLSYLVLRKTIGSVWVAQVGAFFFSIIPEFVILSIVVRHYSLCLFFIWLSLLSYFRMCDHKFESFSDHFLLALTLFLAVMTEYSAIFHMVPLIIIIFIPFSTSQIKQRQWMRILIFSLPYLFVFCLASGLFFWQFNGQIPVLEYMSMFMYQGSLTDFGAMVTFFVHRFPRLMGGILPNPWGLCLVLLLLLPLTPLLRNNSVAKASRSFAFYSLLCISFIFIASLFRFFPFGGATRHTVVIMPGIVLTCFFVVVGIIRKWTSKKNSKIIATCLILLIFLYGFIVGAGKSFIREKWIRPTYKDLCNVASLSKYTNEPGPMVVNWRGRSLISWWFLPKKEPRLIKSWQNRSMVFDWEGTMLFDYEGIKVVQSNLPTVILRTAISHAQQSGQCWILLTYPPASSEISNTYSFLYTELKKDPHVSIRICKKIEFVWPTIIAKIVGNNGITRLKGRVK